MNIAFAIRKLEGFPELGITGAAVATVIARAVELTWAYLDSLAGDRVKLRIGYLLRVDKGLCKDFWKYVTPVLGNEIVWVCWRPLSGICRLWRYTSSSIWMRL